MKPICVPCQRFFRMVHSGFNFVEGRPITKEAKPGNQTPELWADYKIWSGDKWKCEGCGAEIISGVGLNPWREHYEPDFEKVKEMYNAGQFRVNDC